MTIRHLLGQNPVSFNELLDLFEAYAETISPPLEKGCDLIREQFDYSQGDIFSHVFGVAIDSSYMIKDIKRIHADRNRGRDIEITLPFVEAAVVSHSIEVTGRVIEDAATVFGFLLSRAENDDANEDSEGMAIISLARRAVAQAADHDVSRLRRFAADLAKAREYLDVEVEVSA